MLSRAFRVDHCLKLAKLQVSFKSMAPHIPIQPPNYFFYFAYGSNLLEERLHVQIKGAQFEGIGLLRHYKLVFYDHTQRWMGAVASIEPTDELQKDDEKDDEVWGCVWRVSDSFADELDKQESSYHRLSVEIEMDGKSLTCRTYQYSNMNRQVQLPSPHYKHVIISGAIEHCLPPKYIDKLKQINDNGFRGFVNVDLSVLKHLNAVPN